MYLKRHGVRFSAQCTDDHFAFLLGRKDLFRFHNMQKIRLAERAVLLLYGVNAVASLPITINGFARHNAVFHTHSPYATAFAVVRKSIPAVVIESYIFLGGDIRCADYAAPGTEAVGTNAIPALRDRGGCTIANHGVLVVGKDLAQAYLRAEYIEDVAKVYTFSKVLGTPVELASL